MKIVVKSRQIDQVPEMRKVPHSPPYLNRYGAWGYVEKTYSGDHSADVFLDTGAYLKHCPVSSKEWVVPGEEYTSGERDLPPIGARVFVLMPYGNTTYDGAFVLCSGFIVTSKPEKETFMEEEKEKFRKRIKPGNWKELYDYVTGTHEIISPDEKTSMKIDYGAGEEEKEHPELHLKLFEKTALDIIDEDSANLSVFDGEVRIEHKKGENVKIAALDEVEVEHKKGDSIKITAYDTDITIKKGEVTINSKKSTVNIDGDFSLTVLGKADIQAVGPVNVQSTASAKVTAPLVDVDSPAVTVKSAATVITGGTLTNNGTVAPTGTGPFCATPVCPFGFPHIGNVAAGG